MDWTHKKISIIDIRRLKQLYVIYIDVRDIKDSMLIDSEIFDERLRSYFLKDPRNISREDILEAKWNMYITKGYFVKSIPSKLAENSLVKQSRDPEKFYVSFLEIDGPLGSFETIISKPKN